MYPNLYYLFNDLFGINLPFLQALQSFGFMLALSFLAAAWFLKTELKRKAKEGLIKAEEVTEIIGKPSSFSELMISAAGGFAIGFKLIGIALNFQSFVDDPQSYVFSWQGSWIAGLTLGSVLAYLNYREKEKQRLPEPKMISSHLFPHQKIADITIMAALFGLLGAKLFDNLEHPKEFMADPLGSLFSFSGLTFYGSLIFGAGYVIWYCRKHKISIPVMADSIAPALILAYAIGRIGCQLSGDGDWGIVNLQPKPSWFILPDWAWSFTYPHNVINDGITMIDCAGKYCNELPQPVFPTPVYETLFSLVIFSFLWFVRKKIKQSGVLFSLYLIFNGLERILIEQIRINVRYHFLGIQATQAEIIAIILILLGIAGVFFFVRKSNQATQNS